MCASFKLEWQHHQSRFESDFHRQGQPIVDSPIATAPPAVVAIAVTVTAGRWAVIA
jgi:hypothetical protein